MRANNDSMEGTFNMLVLSDMHYQPGETYKSVFRSIFGALKEELKEVWKKHPDWRPHCIALAGDLASNDYVVAKQSGSMRGMHSGQS